MLRESLLRIIRSDYDAFSFFLSSLDIVVKQLSFNLAGHSFIERLRFSFRSETAGFFVGVEGCCLTTPALAAAARRNAPAVEMLPPKTFRSPVEAAIAG